MDRMLHSTKHSYGASCIAAIVPAIIHCICRNRSKDDCKSDLAHIQLRSPALQMNFGIKLLRKNVV
jgi:hypothetical protein